ncbi:hypothetical protein V6N11_026146 [Hibiscus sabdariffa]|uniref:Uncharacterized protein n=1 Tax=Hibiscus sabdariffa TaxID=183260 RepID=A0ABR2SVP7_9ROSI
MNVVVWEYYPGNSLKEDHYNSGEYCNVKNDEAIAHTEEEELQVSGYPRDCVNLFVVEWRMGKKKRWRIAFVNIQFFLRESNLQRSFMIRHWYNAL